MKYIVPQELKSETKLWKWVYLSDLFFIIGYVAIMNLFNLFVPTVLELPYLLFNIIVALSLTISSPMNKKKRIYQSIFYFLITDKFVYKPISESKGEDNEFKS